MKVLAPRLRTLDLRTALPPPKVTDPFYLSPAWLRLIEEIKQERGERCEDPQCRQQGKLGVRVLGDHVVEIKDGGAKLDKANVMLRCWPCHGRKTAAEARRRRGV